MLPVTITLILLWGSVEAHHPALPDSQAQVKRLTFSGSSSAQHPCLSLDGRIMLYIVETVENGTPVRCVKIMNLENGTERDLFRDGMQTAPSPFEGASLLIGSKPPLLSGNGEIAVLSLSIDKPVSIIDHYLAVIPTDGSATWITSFPIADLAGKDPADMGFENGDWERIANYAVDRRGKRIACLLKGHLGPRRFGSASGIVLLDVDAKHHDTLIAPCFREEEWKWDSSPRRPLSGGGWAFSMSADGGTIVFGAQSSDDPDDYDLYLADWNDKTIHKLTEFNDRWFSLADIDQEGKKIVFFYAGKKQQGIGTYIIGRDGTGLKYLKSQTLPRIEFCEFSDDGRFIFYKDVYRIMRLRIGNGEETTVLSESASDSLTETAPLDFPQFPSFWMPRVVSLDGKLMLIEGIPRGKAASEIYLCSYDPK